MSQMGHIKRYDHRVDVFMFLIRFSATAILILKHICPGDFSLCHKITKANGIYIVVREE